MAPADETVLTSWIDEEKATAREYLKSASERAASRSPGVPVTTHVRVGRVSSTVQEVAEELEVDLLVLTTHGRGAFKRSWLGSTADQLLRRIEQPLLLLRHREDSRRAFDPDSLSHVLVPLDGSDAAERALDVLPMVLPQGGGVRVTLAYVVEERHPIPIYIPTTISGESLKEQCRLQGEVYLQRIAERLKQDGEGIMETRVIVDEDASQGLLRFCDEEGVQLIVISTHGSGGLPRFFLGSVTDKLVRGAPVPVLVTKPLGAEPE
jgi:nucleotide-binding universal stress UspA family protein